MTSQDVKKQKQTSDVMVSVLDYLSLFPTIVPTSLQPQPIDYNSLMDGVLQSACSSDVTHSLLLSLLTLLSEAEEGATDLHQKVFEA